MEETKSGSNKADLVGLLVILVAAGAFIELKGKNSSSSWFKDGKYESMGNYVSPAGPEQIDVALTVRGGVVVEAEVTPQATKPMSQKFQGIFKDNYKQYVIGKKIADLSLTKVSGSSLTPKGFNEALEKIRTQAKV